MQNNRISRLAIVAATVAAFAPLGGASSARADEYLRYVSDRVPHFISTPEHVPHEHLVLVPDYFRVPEHDRPSRWEMSRWERHHSFRHEYRPHHEFHDYR